MEQPMNIEILMVSREGKRVGLLTAGRTGPVDAILPQRILGEVSLAGGSSAPDWTTFRRSSAFVAFYVDFMRGRLSVGPLALSEARVKPGDFVYIIDPRIKDAAGKVPFDQIVGWYKSDRDGRPIADSFGYNPDHALVTKAGEVSGICLDPVFAGVWRLGPNSPAE
jgi:hypothetical protein